MTLSGCVKHSTRNYWQRILNDNASIIPRRSRRVNTRLGWRKRTTTPFACHCSNVCGNKEGNLGVRWTEHEMRRLKDYARSAIGAIGISKIKLGIQMGSKGLDGIKGASGDGARG